MKKWISALLLCLLPAAALAVQEGVVEEAAMVDVSAEAVSEAPSYLPDESYYAYDYGYEPKWGASETYVEPEYDGECFGPSAQAPNLTSGEIIRAKALLAAYQSSEATGDGASVLNASQDVVLGVYPLNPADYDGETVFVILPNTSIPDELMLAMIDAFHQLGLTFDPEGFTYRNCMRGGGIECTRFFSDEEQERRTTLHNLIRSGKLTGVEARNELHIALDRRYFNGLDGFSFRPYRKMTDEELAGHLVAMGVRDESAEMDFDGIEKQTRALLKEAFSCPLSMTLETISRESAYTPCTFGEDGTPAYAETEKSAIYTSYRYPKDGCEMVLADVSLDAETGRAVSLSMTEIPVGWIQSETPRDPAVDDEAYFDVAETFVREHMGAYIENPDALVWEMHEQEEWWTNYGLSVKLAARLPKTNGLLEVYVGCEDMQVHNVQIQMDQRDWFEGLEFRPLGDYPRNG